MSTTQATHDDDEQMREQTYNELVTYMNRQYDRGDNYGIGGPFTGEADEVAFVSTEDENLYAELQGAGFRIAFPERRMDDTRFYVLPLNEPMYRSFVDEAANDHE